MYNNLTLDEIESIEFVGEKPTKDISVASDDRLFFCNGIYTHNSAANEEIITGDQVAESYKKIMTGDVVISISRKTEDKLANTARWHVIKNRYGIDGITFPSKVDSSVGRIEIFAPDSVSGYNTRKEMKNSNELVKKELAEKYKDFQKESDNKPTIEGEFE
jgi:hypothetical protein